MLDCTAYVQAAPKNLSSVEAASIPLTGCNAWDALIFRAHVLHPYFFANILLYLLYEYE
jgi:NADPH:quinone reductase-like Zn-dependent oxidoreductase